MKSQKLATLPRPSTNLQGGGIYVFVLDTAHWKFVIMVSFIKQSFQKMKFGSYPQSTDFNELHIEYEQMLLKKLLLDFF